MWHQDVQFFAVSGESSTDRYFGNIKFMFLTTHLTPLNIKAEDSPSKQSYVA